MTDLLVVRDVVKTFPLPSALSAQLRRQPAPTMTAVDGVSLDVGRQEIVGLVGESGSGKTTLARCLVRLYEPDSGSATFDGRDVFGASSSQLRAIRRRMQLIYQDPYSSLNPLVSVGDAVSEPARVHGLVRRGAPQRALVAELLQSVGLSPRDADRRPRELSGGQRQRVAIARALVGKPSILLADEPTGNLDSATSLDIMNLIRELHADGQTVVIVTHEPEIAEQCQRVVRLRDGRVMSDTLVAERAA
jgi:ABC-type glutathione transport system ATPase component